MKSGESTIALLLQQYVSSLPETLLRVDEPRKQLLKKLSGISDTTEEDLVIQFEREEASLRKTVFISNWSVYFNVFTDKVIFEHILNVNTIARIAELREKNIRRELKEIIQELDPLQFENLVASFFRELPWCRGVRTTKRSHDEGIDVKGTYVDPKARIELPLFGQVKKWGSKVDFSEITKFLGALDIVEAPSVIGVFVSSHGFTKEAQDGAKRSKHKVILYDAASLIELMIENSIGVKQTVVEVISPDEGFWSEIHP